VVDPKVVENLPLGQIVHEKLFFVLENEPNGHKIDGLSILGQYEP
jgi:hypothetical protein